MNEKSSPINISAYTRSLNLDALRSFLAIYETGSFRNAAAKVNLSPSAVSLQISKLEDVLGHILLHRNARCVTLTEDGELLVQQAKALLALNDETLALFCGSASKGRITLAAPQDMGMDYIPLLLRHIANRYPRIQVDVQLAASAAVTEGFSKGQSNIALFNSAGTPMITSERIWSEPLVWLMAQGGRAAFLDLLPLAVAAKGCAWREEALKALDKVGRPYRIAYGSDTPLGQAAAVRADLAIAALPLSAVTQDVIVVPDRANLPTLPQTEIRIAYDGGNLSQEITAMIKSIPYSTRPGN